MRPEPETPEDPTRMPIAATDLGSNSFHMVIVGVRSSGGFRLITGVREVAWMAVAGTS